MLKQGTFVNKKINRLMLGNIWGILAYCINVMTDSLISGSQLGEVSLQAVSIVYPLAGVVGVFCYLFAPGAGVIIGKYMGEFKKQEAYRTVGSCVVSSVILGVLLALSMWLLKTPFLNYYECTGELMRDASNYYDWIICLSIIAPIQTSLYYFCAVDGETFLISLANIVGIVLNISLSIIMSRQFGVSGLGMATCISTFLSGIIYLLHFLKKNNSVKIVLCLDFRILRRALLLSFSNYTYYLFIAVVDIVMNKIIINNCGIEFIPAYTVVNLVFTVCELFETVEISCFGFLTCFHGERNNHGMNLVFKKATRAVLLVGTCLTFFFFFGANLMPLIYGLETPVTINASVMASKIMAFTAIGFGACYLISSMSCSLEKPLQSCLMSFLMYVFAQLFLPVVFSKFWGFTGIVIGMSLSSYFAFGLYALIRIPCKGKKGFPLYAKDYGEEGFSFDLHVTPDSIPKIRDSVCEEMRRHGYEIDQIKLLMEDFFTRVMDENPHKIVLAECTLLFGKDQVRIVIRDDGKIFKYMDELKKVDSQNGRLLNSILEQEDSNDYLLTMSFNRNRFFFRKEKTKIS